MTWIKEMPVTRLIDYKNSQLVEDFIFYSDVLKCQCVIPAGFTMDWESVPLLQGTSKVSGLIHDYLCREDAIPIVTKRQAADVYLEFLKFRETSYIRRYVKYWAVRWASSYFHKLPVLSTDYVQNSNGDQR